MRELAWTTTEVDLVLFRHWQNTLFFERNRLWLLPYSAMLMAAAAVAVVAHQPWAALGIFTGGPAFGGLLWRAFRVKSRFEVNDVAVDARGIHLRKPDDPDTAMHFGWSGMTAFRQIRGGVVVDAAYKLWVLVPERAADLGQLQMIRASAEPPTLDAPTGYDRYEMKYQIDRSFARPVADPRRVPPPPASPWRAAIQTGSVIALSLIFLGARFMGYPLVGAVGFGAGTVIAAVALFAALQWAQRDPDWRGSDRQRGIGSWQVSAGDRGIWFRSATAVSALGWPAIHGAWRDDDRVLIRLRASAFRSIPLAAFADAAAADNFVDWVESRQRGTLAATPPGPVDVFAPPAV